MAKTIQLLWMKFALDTHFFYFNDLMRKKKTDGITVLHLGVSIPADCSGVPHLPVLDKFGPGTQAGSVRKVLIQKRSRHGWNHQGTGTLWTSGQEIRNRKVLLSKFN